MSPFPTVLGLVAAFQAPDLDRLHPAKVTVDPAAAEIVIELPPIDLPAHSGHHGEAGYPPVVLATMPVDASLYGFRVEVRDQDGQELPSDLIHHFNLIDPDNRELFLPISRRILAAGKETGSQRLPRFLFGLPMRKGDRMVASAMLHNPTGTDYREVRTRLVLNYVPADKFWPLFDGYPFQLDVAFPVGDKSFSLPPGQSSRSYGARPSVPGRIVAVGGHMHELGTRIELTEVETGKVIWSARPELNRDGTVVGVPIGKLYGLFKVGYPVRPDRTYRVTVYYDNPRADTLETGGMGVIGGLFLPDRGVDWPAPDKRDSLYVQDARHYLRIGQTEPLGMKHKHD